MDKEKVHKIATDIFHQWLDKCIIMNITDQWFDRQVYTARFEQDLTKKEVTYLKRIIKKVRKRAEKIQSKSILLDRFDCIMQACSEFREEICTLDPNDPLVIAFREFFSTLEINKLNEEARKKKERYKYFLYST